jgi:hypothetical protein
MRSATGAARTAPGRRGEEHGAERAVPLVATALAKATGRGCHLGKAGDGTFITRRPSVGSIGGSHR